MDHWQKKRLSLRARLVLRQSAWFALFVIALAGTSYEIASRRLFDRLDGQLEDRSATVRSMLQIRSGDVRWLDEKADADVREAFARATQYFQLLDNRASIVEASRGWTAAHLAVTSPALQALHAGMVKWETVFAGNARYRVLNTAISGEAGQPLHLLRVAMPLAEVEESARQLTRVLWFMVPALIFLHLALAWILSGHALQPLERMSETARNIAFPEDARRPLALSTEEVEQLSEAINDRLQHLHQSSQQINEFLPDVSHELRRTLAALRAETERALRWASSEEEYRQALSNQLEQIELSTRMLSDMFLLAQTESGTSRAARKTESLSELVGAAVDSMHAVAAEHGIEVLQSVEESVVGEVDAGQIWRLLLNLIDNAIKYNRPSGRVEVVLASHGNLAMISVSDTGCGIPKADIDRIFDRFYRSPEAVRSGVQGTGLGLCFARSIVEAHGGRIEVTSSPGEGSCFRIWLPLMSTTALAEFPAVSGSQVSAVN